MAGLPKGFGINLEKTITQKRPTSQKQPTISVPKKPSDKDASKRKADPIEVIDINEKEDAPLKRQKAVDPSQSLVYAFLGASSAPFIKEEEVRSWSLRTDTQTEEAMAKAAAELHFHASQVKSLNSRLRTRLQIAETEKLTLSRQLRNKEEQYTKLKEGKDKFIADLRSEKARLESEIRSMSVTLENLSTTNATLQLEKDALEDDKLQDWSAEKKSLEAASFEAGFKNYASGFIAVDPDYDFSKFGAETVKWIEDFKKDYAEDIKNKRIFLGLDKAEDASTTVFETPTLPQQSNNPSPPKDSNPQDAPPVEDAP